MRKPLELTVYPKSVGRHGEAVYVDESGQWTYPVSHVDGYAEDKRLTDAELAAEYFNAEAHRRTIELHMEGIKDLPAYERAGEIQDRIHNFASLPSYDEVA